MNELHFHVLVSRTLSDIFPLGGDVAGWVAFAPDLGDDALADLPVLLEADAGASGNPLSDDLCLPLSILSIPPDSDGLEEMTYRHATSQWRFVRG